MPTASRMPNWTEDVEVHVTPRSRTLCSASGGLWCLFRRSVVAFCRIDAWSRSGVGVLFLTGLEGRKRDTATRMFGSACNLRSAWSYVTEFGEGIEWR